MPSSVLLLFLIVCSHHASQMKFTREHTHALPLCLSTYADLMSIPICMNIMHGFNCVKKKEKQPFKTFLDQVLTNKPTVTWYLFLSMYRRHKNYSKSGHRNAEMPFIDFLHFLEGSTCWVLKFYPLCPFLRHTKCII